MDIPEPQLFDALVSRAALQIIVTEAETGLIVYVNDAYAKQRDTTPEQLIGKTVGDLELWQSEAERLRWRQKIVEEGHATQRFDFVNPDGSRGASTLFTQLLSQDGASYFISYNIDVSTIVEVEQEREEALAQLRRAQEIAKIADFKYDAATRLITGTDQLAKLLQWKGEGIPVEELLSSRIHPDDLNGVRDQLNSDPDEFKFSTRYVFDDGEHIWLELIGSVSRNEHGEMTQWNGTIQDITERKVAEMEQLELDEKMRTAQKLESLGILAGGVAHDFNNLLVGIMGNADIALMETGLPDAARNRLADIVSASQRAADLTNQLLAYSGKGRFVIKDTNLAGLVREMGELLRISVSARSSLNVEYLADPVVSIDQTQIRQVVMNLIINAAEAVEPGQGRIAVEIGIKHRTKEFFDRLGAPREPGEYAYVQVTDNGSGMSAEVQEKLFEPFFTTKLSGRGLGMSAVLGIIRGHKGAITIDSELGTGTTFTVYLPTTAATVDADVETSSNVAVAGSNRTALIVDDDVTVSRMLASAVESMGFSALTAGSGEEGIELVSSGKDIALILLDLTMPGLDGIATFEQIKLLGSPAKVILMSGYTQQEAMGSFKGKGITGFLQKPFRLDDLQQVIQDSL